MKATTLAPIYDWFTEGFDTRDLKDAKALLEELAQVAVPQDLTVSPRVGELVLRAYPKTC